MSKTGKAEAKTDQPTVSKEVSQEAKQTNWLLLGGLKNIDKQFLRIGTLLTKMRDEQLYAALRDEHKNYYTSIDSYAAAELHLGKTSLYHYLTVYDWVKKSHPEWLTPKPKGFIPDLSDCSDLMWIEKELTRKDLDPSKRAILQALQKKGLEGTLREKDLRNVRKRTNDGGQGLKAFLSKLRSLRRRGAQLENMPAEVISFLDSAIRILGSQNALAQYLIEFPSRGDRTYVA